VRHQRFPTACAGGPVSATTTGSTRSATGGTLSWALEAAEERRAARGAGTRTALGNADGVLTPFTRLAEDMESARCWPKARGVPRWKPAAAAPIGPCTSKARVAGIPIRGRPEDDGVGSGGEARAARSQRSVAYEADFFGEVDRLRGDSRRGAFVAASEDFAAVLDSLDRLQVPAQCFTDFYTQAQRSSRGSPAAQHTAAEMRRAGSAFHTLRSCFTVRRSLAAGQRLGCRTICCG